MDYRVARFFKQLEHKTVAFVGIGVSHIPTIQLFAKQGINTIAVDRREEPALDPEAIASFKELGVGLVLGDYTLEGLGADVIFRTPGMYFYQPEITAYRQNGGIITSEMEVFFQLCPCTTIAVTGSDGKTTSTTLIAKFLEASGKTVHLGGNIGKALLPEIFDIQPDDFAVVELSSFQLLSMRPSPNVSVVTNVTPNHLDVHATMEEYVDSKRTIYQHQNAFSQTVLGKDSEISYSFKDGVRGELSLFSLTTPVTNGAYLKENGMLTVVRQGVEAELFHKDDIRLPGIHNVANYLTAISAVARYADLSKVHEIAKTFGGVEHRIEFVRERNGVKWYNDSIASSPNRSIAGLQSFSQKVILLAGGYDKKLPFTPLAPYIIEHVKLLILAGPTSKAIEEAVLSHPDYSGTPRILHAVDIPEAVRLADDHSQEGDIITLSPASTSFDAYPNFEYRGRHFKELVHNLK